MLSPKKVKHRKRQKGRNSGIAFRGSKPAFGTYALQSLEPGWLTDRQIEAGRVAMTRHVKRGGRVWIRVFPDKPVTKKPAEVRMGKGKGSPEQWVARIKQGRILFEMEGVEPDIAAKALQLAAMKLPVKTRFLDPDQEGLFRMKASELRELTDEEMAVKLEELRKEGLNQRFGLTTQQLENPAQMKFVRRDIARVLTIMTERKKANDGKRA